MNDAMVPGDAVLQMTGVNKRFVGVQALQDVDFGVRRGEIHALVGHNGAGKSTLLKILAGVYSADSGEIVLNGESASGWRPQRILDHGVSFIYQELNLVQSMSVAQNIMLGREPRTAWGMIDWKAMRASAQAALARIAADGISVRLPLNQLSVAKQQLVAIGRALDQHPTLLVLDEPTSRLGLEDTERLFDLLKQMRADGLSIVYVSHRLDEIYRIADRVTVLRDGQLVFTGETESVSPDELVQHMIGDRVQQSMRRRLNGRGETVLEVRQLRGPGIDGGLNLDIHRGEVVGLVGAVGAGKTELVHLLFGLESPLGGEVRIGDRSLTDLHASELIRQGMALCPEDRKEQGLLLDSSIRENVTLAGLRQLSLGRWFPNRQRETTVANDLVERLRIATPSIKRHARTLSGGNQQKVVLARWLCTQSQVFIFDEPTVGVDVRGKSEIYDLMYELADQGAGVLFVTSDIEEGLLVSQRVLTMYRGRIVSELNSEDTNLEEVLLYVMGGRPDART